MIAGSRTFAGHTRRYPPGRWKLLVPSRRIRVLSEGQGLSQVDSKVRLLGPAVL